MTKGESHLLRVNADVRLPTLKDTRGSDPISPKTPLPASSGKVPAPESIPSPLTSAFKTWVPDGSLRFINPDFLSSAEKQTLEQQVQVEVKASVGKRKESEPSIKYEDKGEKAVDRRNDSGNGNDHEERPKKMGRPLPLIQNEDLLGPPPLATISFPLGRPSTFTSALQRRHSRPSLTQPNEMDLLRQVKSNNLSMPTLTQSSRNTTHGSNSNVDGYLNWIPTGNYPQDRVQYNHIHNQHRQQVHHQQLHQPQHRLQNKQNDLFTYKPLYHPTNLTPNSYTYHPEQTPPNRRSSTSSTDIHPRDRNFSPLPTPTTSACVSDSPPLTELPSSEAGPLAMNLPRGDWRRKYVGRGRGQSGG